MVKEKLIDLHNHSAWRGLLIDDLENLGKAKILFLYKEYSKIMPFGKMYFQAGMDSNKLPPQHHKVFHHSLFGLIQLLR